VRGAVRVVAAVATRLKPLVDVVALQPRDLATWKALHQHVEARHETRRAQARFRRDPAAYLTNLESQLVKPALPP
jgi:hypothetical protein